MAHNSRNERIDFLYFFLNNVKNGSSAYKSYLLPILSEAKELAEGSRNIYELTPESRDVKILLQEVASEWLFKINVSTVGNAEISELQNIIRKSEDTLVF
ncbi:hypothetical protein BCY89_13940 [Sphingobacterium siyangense]|uniref:Uncharacterized protein n=1 Tax=Sphingobacterium siyangense TaxID=459529 RepID=A0A420FH76_9SPHI|nr:hypothetical protein [Sphingobacterium siyangense]RKF32294.1 hypothetical protein BCY89_13940 [Sphingobacterium siyangense]